jgi:hypothetical protein
MRKLRYTVAIIVFSIGVITGMLLAGTTTVANMEAATYFGYNGYANTPSAGVLTCPNLLTAGEIGKVSLAVHNPSDREVNAFADVQISDGALLVRELSDSTQVPPGQSTTLEWTVSPDDVVYDHFIMVQADLMRSFDASNHVDSCGIFVVNLPWLTGRQMLMASLAVSVLCMLAGVAVFARWQLPAQTLVRRPYVAMTAITVSVSLAVLFGILGFWALGTLAWVVSVLLIVQVLSAFLQRADSQ